MTVLAGLLEIRKEDRRDALIAVATLFGAMAAHAMLETARDALFLSALPAGLLPWAYVAIAVSSLAVAAASRFLRRTIAPRFSLSLVLVLGGGITAAFYRPAGSQSATVFLALYVWTGALASAITVEFWLLVAAVLDIGQAKRVFAVIGAGGLAGAAAGAASAGALLEVLPPRSLLLVAGAVFATTAAAPWRLSPTVNAAPMRKADTGSALQLVRREPYLLRLLGVVLASSALLTGVDFLFKATAATDLAPDQLGEFFARFYALTSLLALLVQLIIAPRLLRALGVNTSLLLLPSLLVLGSTGFVLASGLGAAIVLRGADGALRHSLHRTGIEILYVPLPGPVRERFKGFVEAFGQRGGQALASLALLVALSLGARNVHVGMGLALASICWLGLTLGIRPHYVDLFRKNLREGFLETHAEVPDLDLHSFEALISALSAENDQEVLASLDLLESYGKSSLVPALILYHPSPEVVLRAFSLFSGAGRSDVDRLVERLLQHDDERVRAAALRYLASRSDTALLERMATDPASTIRTTALVELVRRGAIDEWKGGDLLRGVIDGNSAELRRALAIAARDLPRGRYSWALVRLAFVREPGLSVEVARSMAAAPDPDFVPTLVRLLAERECREHARAAILSLGVDTLDALDAALWDPTLPHMVRRHLPRTIARLGGQRAASVLEHRLLVETDEIVELKTVRALKRLRASDPTIRVDAPALLDLANREIGRAVLLLHHRAVTHRTIAEGVASRSQVSDMLGALLSDKQTGTLERVFQILSVLDPKEDFETLFAALRSNDVRLLESGRELVGHVVPEPIRSGILAIFENGSLESRLALVSRWHASPERARFERLRGRLDPAGGGGRAGLLEELGTLHVESLRSMLADPSDAVRSVASFRIAELGISELTAELRSSSFSPGGALGALSLQALELLERQAEVSRAG